MQRIVQCLYQIFYVWLREKNSQIYVQKKIDLFHNPVPGYKKGLYTSDPVGSLEYIKNDSKLKLTKDEWEYARETAFNYLKERLKNVVKLQMMS